MNMHMSKIDPEVTYLVKNMITAIKVGLDMIGEVDMSIDAEDKLVDEVLRKLHMVEDYTQDYTIIFTEEEDKVLKLARELRKEEYDRANK